MVGLKPFVRVQTFGEGPSRLRTTSATLATITAGPSIVLFRCNQCLERPTTGPGIVCLFITAVSAAREV